MQSELAQAAAQQRAVIAGGQAGRGVAGGGHEGRVMGGVMNESNAASQMINARVMGENQLARDRNLSQFASTSGMYNQADLAYLSSMAGVGGMYGDLQLGGERVDQAYLDGILRAAAAKAGINQSAQYMPTDFASFQNLADSREAAERERAFMDEKLAFEKEQAEPDWMDYATFGMGMMGTGIPGAALGLIESFLGGSLFGGGQ